MTRASIAVALLGIISSPVIAQDRVTFRDRSAKGSQTVSGKIESESLAGIRIATGQHRYSDRGEIAAADQRLDPDPGLEPRFHLRAYDDAPGRVSCSIAAISLSR